MGQKKEGNDAESCLLREGLYFAAWMQASLPLRRMTNGTSEESVAHIVNRSTGKVLRGR